VPRFAQHSFVVDAPDTQLLNFYLPSGFEMFVMGFSHPAERNELPPAGIPLAPRRLIEQLSRDYGQIPILGLPGADAPTAENMATEPLPEAAVQPFVSNAETSPAYWYEGGLWAILASGEATDGSYCLIEQVRVRGGATPPQVHLDTDVVFYVLDGEMTFLLDDRIETASKGDLVFIPRKSVYALRIDSGRARFLNLYTPSGFERILSNLGYPAITRELPPFEWRAPPVNSDQKSRLFADLGIRSIAVPNPIS
jgi:mannose-6-phosphate isomerase-like protein (cupin superfamily)